MVQTNHLVILLLKATAVNPATGLKSQSQQNFDAKFH